LTLSAEGAAWLGCAKASGTAKAAAARTVAAVRLHVLLVIVSSFDSHAARSGGAVMDALAQPPTIER